MQPLCGCCLWEATSCSQGDSLRAHWWRSFCTSSTLPVPARPSATACRCFLRRSVPFPRSHSWYTGNQRWGQMSVNPSVGMEDWVAVLFFYHCPLLGPHWSSYWRLKTPPPPPFFKKKGNNGLGRLNTVHTTGIVFQFMHSLSNQWPGVVVSHIQLERIWM